MGDEGGLEHKKMRSEVYEIREFSIQHLGEIRK